MKKLCLFLMLATISSACEGESAQQTDENPCPDWQIQVSTTQKIRLLNSNGEPNQNINPDRLSVISTDQNWNPLFTDDGVPIRDLGNIIGVTPVLSSSGYVDYLIVGLGQVKIENRCYFLLQINDSVYHQIIANYNIDCGDMILTNFQYNGIAYTANDWDVIDVVVD